MGHQEVEYNAMTDNTRLHTPSFDNPDLPEGYAACLSCGALMTVDQLLELCPKEMADAAPAQG